MVTIWIITFHLCLLLWYHWPFIFNKGTRDKWRKTHLHLAHVFFLLWETHTWNRETFGLWCINLFLWNPVLISEMYYFKLFLRVVVGGNTSSAFTEKPVGLSNFKLSTSTFEVGSFSENFFSCFVSCVAVYTFYTCKLWKHYFTIHVGIWVICWLLTVFMLGFEFIKAICKGNDCLRDPVVLWGKKPQK